MRRAQALPAEFCLSNPHAAEPLDARRADRPESDGSDPDRVRVDGVPCAVGGARFGTAVVWECSAATAADRPVAAEAGAALPVPPDEVSARRELRTDAPALASRFSTFGRSAGEEAAWTGDHLSRTVGDRNIATLKDSRLAWAGRRRRLGRTRTSRTGRWWLRCSLCSPCKWDRRRRRCRTRRRCCSRSLCRGSRRGGIRRGCRSRFPGRRRNCWWRGSRTARKWRTESSRERRSKRYAQGSCCVLRCLIRIVRFRRRWSAFG